MYAIPTELMMFNAIQNYLSSECIPVRLWGYLTRFQKKINIKILILTGEQANGINDSILEIDSSIASAGRSSKVNIPGVKLC